jgi:hypothetical protein
MSIAELVVPPHVKGEALVVQRRTFQAVAEHGVQPARQAAEQPMDTIERMLAIAERSKGR